MKLDVNVKRKYAESTSLTRPYPTTPRSKTCNDVCSKFWVDAVIHGP